jgi:hypothetical protein
MAKTLEVFGRIKKKDPGFVIAMDVDDKKRVRSLLFAHGSSRIDYASFGDVVTFDTTYQTNLYNLPFGLFVGVNNHFPSIIFATYRFSSPTTCSCVLLSYPTLMCLFFSLESAPTTSKGMRLHDKPHTSYLCAFSLPSQMYA